MRFRTEMREQYHFRAVIGHIDSYQFLMFDMALTSL
jgi:hypothetical protein